MASPAARVRTTYADYLAFQLSADVRYEFVDGAMFAMAGGTRGHGLVQTGVVGALTRLLTGQPCRPAGSDNRLYIPAYGEGLYPDVHVVCGRAEFDAADPDAVINPVLVVEVLSPSTEAWDRGGKFRRYESLPSLKEYLLITVDEPCAELWRRNDDSTFTRHLFTESQAIELQSVGVSLPLPEVYALLAAERDAERDAERASPRRPRGPRRAR